MGQAKQRGTFEQRKAAAEERNRKEQIVKAQLAQRRPSPKHVALMGMIAALSQCPTAERSGRAVARSKRSELTRIVMREIK